MELQKFEKVECEWPLFFCFLILDGIFSENPHQVAEYKDMLEEVLVKGDHGLKFVPELYTVPRDKVFKLSSKVRLDNPKIRLLC